MKNIRSKYVKESLLDYERLTNTLKENSSNAVKDLLGEAIRDTYKKILSESDEDEYDEEEVEDTDTDNASTNSNDTQKSFPNKKGSKSNFDKNGNYQNGGEQEMEEDDDAEEETTTEVTPDGGVQKTTQGSDGEGNEWSQFEKYKVSDDKYDFSEAEDDEIVKAYKLMKDDDQLIVTKDGGMVHLQDNQTGADYIIDLGSVPDEDEATPENDGSDAVEADYDDEGEDEGLDSADMEIADEVDDFRNDNSDDFSDEGDDFEDDDDDFENDNEEDNFMNEQKIFEIALNEYNSNVGYTDNYQKKDVMTNPGMSEPAKSSSTNDWDKGVPHGTEKPWSKQKKSVGPFNGEKGKTVEEEYELECGDVESPEANLEEAGMNVGGMVQQHSKSRSDIPSGRKDYGMRTKHSVHTAQDGHVGDIAESTKKIVNKANAIFEENKQLKKALKEFRNTLSEAAVTNVNLGQIIKLISENTTSSDEKKEIISRFGKEAKTIDASKALYESISNDLKKKNKMNINEDKQFTANSSQMINETQIYKSDDLMSSLGMMHKICKF